MPAVRVSLTAAGTVSDYDDTQKASIASAFATSAGVAADKVTVTILPGSVIIDVEIRVPTAAASQSTQTALSTQLSSAQSATTFLSAASVTVTSTPSIAAVTVQEVVVAPPPPSPTPSSPVAEGDSTTSTVAIIAGIAVGLTWFIVGLVYCMRKKSQPAPSEVSLSGVQLNEGDVLDDKTRPKQSV